MELREFLFRNNLSGAEFGRMLNYDPQYINHIARGFRKPGKKLIKLIEKATYGKVKESDLLATFDQKKPKSHHNYDSDYHADYHLTFPCRQCQDKQKHDTQENPQKNSENNL